MSWTVTIGGQTFTNANVDGTAYADEVTGFPAIIAAMATEAAFLKGVGNTSTTSLTPGSGTKTLTLNQTPGFSVGMLAAAQSVSDPSHYMVGSVAAINGSDIDITVTIASGGTAKSDWVVTYPVPGTITDANGDLAISTGSIWTTASDADWNAGGNRTFIDMSGGQGRMGTAHGGGAATSLGFYVDSQEIWHVDVGNTWRSIASLGFNAGLRVEGEDAGTKTGSWDVHWYLKQHLKVTLGANIIINFKEDAANWHHVKTLYVFQDGTGGRVPTFLRESASNLVHWITAEPDWAGQAAGVVTKVVAEHSRTTGHLYLYADQDVHA